MRSLTVAFCMLLSYSAVCQNGPCTEKTIKEQLAKSDVASIWADDGYFYSRAIDKPVVGRTKLDESMKSVAVKRKNEKDEFHVDRTVISPDGNMAYEYGTGHVVFDSSDNQHSDFSTLFLRVWKVADGQCRIAALMAQPSK